MASFSHILVSTEGTGKPVDHYTAATPTTQIDNPNLDTGSDQDRFGAAVAVSGTKVLVGAPHEDAAGFANSGKAYYYNGSTTPTFVFDNPTDGTPDYFGAAVAVDGANVVIGAFGDDDPETDSGKVYYYNVQGYFPTTPDITFVNPVLEGFGPHANDQFGYSVAIDGDYIVAGAPFEDDSGIEDAGRAYVFRISTQTLLQTLTQPTPGNNEFFGKSVAVSGEYALVGAPGRLNDSGAAYLYNATAGGDPVIQFSNPNQDENNLLDNFGESVAISGRYVIIGAPKEDNSDGTVANWAGVAYVFDILDPIDPTVPILSLVNPDRTLSGEDDLFGMTVSIDGIHAVVGAPGTGTTNVGATYVYDITETPDVNGNIAPFETITNPTPAAEDKFGSGVGISGSLVVVGAEGANIAYPYSLS